MFRFELVSPVSQPLKSRSNVRGLVRGLREHSPGRCNAHGGDRDQQCDEDAVLQQSRVKQTALLFATAMKLRHDPASLTAKYRAGDPFPHIVLDNLFDDADLEGVLREFPRPDAMRWMKFDNRQEKKLGFYYESSTISDRVRRFLDAMNGFEMLLFLERLTGIEGLIPDPYFGGGGLHQIEPGGFLKVHADFNVHPKLHLDRRLNMLIYLNKDWREEYGGHLELWDAALKSPRQKILPIFNRTVVFSTTDHSYHGHPHPLTSPPGVTRKSVSLYYYTAGRPAEERSAAHDTLFVDP
jgi:Rps23 Pro-64 3,4-dihydroxylase Tpa1-like proline 4-hydroxylase